MAKLKVLLADTDEYYLAPLEYKMIEEFADNLELHIITDTAYLEWFFSTPQTMDIAVISEKIFVSDYTKHNIANLFVLTEEEDTVFYGNAVPLYKYTSIKEIFSKIAKHSATVVNRSNKPQKTKLLMVYSPVGGSGQTAVSAGLCSALAKNFQNVLFLSLDSLQGFGFLLAEPKPLQPGSEKAVLAKSEYAYQTLKPFIVKQQFDILPPFSAAPSFLGLQSEHYLNLLEGISASGDYDYIVIDGPDDFSGQTSALMAEVDHTILVTTQHIDSIHKMEALLNLIDCSDYARFSMVCNQYTPAQENHLLSEGSVCKNYNYEYIEKIDGFSLPAYEKLGMCGSMQKLSLAFM